MPAKPERPDHPEAESLGRTDLERAMTRQRNGRRRVVVAAAALVVGLVSAACTTANAATPGGKDLSAYSTASRAGGHSGHGGGAPAAENPEEDAAGDPAAEEGAAEDGAAEGDAGEGEDETVADEDAAAGQKGGKDGAKPGNDGKGKGNGGAAGDKPDNGLDVLGRDCAKSKLPDHTGFQVAPACVDTAFGEVAGADKSPALLITDAPDEAKVGESFTIKVSTRNLVRDRFLGAAAGGYYLESSFLDKNGLQRGHFHTACRMLPSLDEAPDSSPDPAFFLATQDNKGGAGTDTVDVVVTGLPEKGTAQCTSWAGDGSHRIPMMQRANQTPAVDSVRVTIK